MRRICPGLGFLLALIYTSFSSAESRGHYSLTYQYIKVDGIEVTIGSVDSGTKDAQTLLLGLDDQLIDWLVDSADGSFPLGFTQAF